MAYPVPQSLSAYTAENKQVLQSKSENICGLSAT